MSDISPTPDIPTLPTCKFNFKEVGLPDFSDDVMQLDTSSCDSHWQTLFEMAGDALKRVIRPGMNCVDTPRVIECITKMSLICLVGGCTVRGASYLAYKYALHAFGTTSVHGDDCCGVATQAALDQATFLNGRVPPVGQMVEALRDALGDSLIELLMDVVQNPYMQKYNNEIAEKEWKKVLVILGATKSFNDRFEQKHAIKALIEDLAGKSAPEQALLVFQESTMINLASLEALDLQRALSQIADACSDIPRPELKKALTQHRQASSAQKLIADGEFRTVRLDQIDRDILRQTLFFLSSIQELDASIFVMSGKLARIVQDENNCPRVELITEPPQLSYVLSEQLTFLQTNSSGHLGTRSPSNKLLGDILNCGRYDLPALKGLTRIPILRADGSIKVDRGYDRDTRLYHFPSMQMQEFPPCKGDVAKKQIEKNVQWINENLFFDFPFLGDADRAHAWAELFTLVLREHIDGCVPAFLHDAPTKGTGKSLLARLVSVIATGTDAGLLSKPEDESEMKKTLTATLIEGSRLIVFDNYEGKLNSPALCKVITCREHQDRILGKSTTVTVPMNAVPIVTMNNCQVGGDMSRRCVLIRLDAKVSKPWQRDSSGFAHPDLITWAKANRPKAIESLLYIASHWLKEGCLKPTNLPSFGNFERWVEVIGGVLEYAGIPGFLQNMHVVEQMVDVDTPQIEGFLLAMHEVCGHGSIDQRTRTSTSWRDIIDRSSELVGMLPDELADAHDRIGTGFTRSLGRWFAANKDRRFGACGIRIEEAGKQQNAILWKLAWDQEPPRQGRMTLTHADGTREPLAPRTLNQAA